MKHPLQEMMDKRRQGIRCGIPSYCSANELVIETPCAVQRSATSLF
jgi:D-tagatose-1,6-bisphosphate aldolase subunit GatZ/KbaZ